FADEAGIGELLGERAAGGELEVHLYYCDPRQSQQKGGCEKNTPRSARSWRRACSPSTSSPARTCRR
ncbi:hypothetical protein, partial [Adlercreutzia sp. ZJ473]|uniref:hypothetical protein n=1 Tax=Adlercreutzia sp. ZJ473 TaxID=2722822 RepID=UPI0015555AB5